MQGFRDTPVRNRAAFFAEGQTLPHGRVSEFFAVSRHKKGLPGKMGTPHFAFSNAALPPLRVRRYHTGDSSILL